MTLTTTHVPLWGRFEAHFTAHHPTPDPVRDVRLEVAFEGPKGAVRRVSAFWDGGWQWRVRFSPDACGAWRFRTSCNPPDAGLDGLVGEFTCDASAGGHAFDQHGPVRVAANRRYLEHADGTPFLWVGDTAWNGPLLSTSDEWQLYLRERVRQRFSVVQWVATQWLASSRGDRDGRKAFSGREHITIDPEFFRRLDERVEATARAGLLNVPVMLWAAEWSTPEVNGFNPGFFLPEEDAILLGRMLVARWAAYPIVWLLPGDGVYLGEKADRWRRIGRGIFGDQPHAPVMLHPAGMQWNGAEFAGEPWLDLLGYQSGHGDNNETLSWLVSGPPASAWRDTPARPVINLEPPYEDHVGYHSKERLSADFVRRALYWSLLVSPTAGVTYGAHGVWAWDLGGTAPESHPNAGVAQPWRTALRFVGAEQIRHLVAAFTTAPWWRLQPAPELLASQPGDPDRRRFIAVAATADRDFLLAYTPDAKEVRFVPSAVNPDADASWFNPRTGERTSALAGEAFSIFAAPGPGDWLLIVRQPSQTRPQS